MLLTYCYKGQVYKLFIHWTADTGCSAVFRDIAREVLNRHGLDPGEYQGLAEYLDSLADKLYEQFYIFSNEYSGVPYNPGFRRNVLHIFSEINNKINGCLEQDNPEDENPLVGLFMNVADKLRGMVDIYLADNAYQCKFRERMRSKEEYLETTAQSLISCEFEDILLQMTDLARVLDCLTDIQRRRLVKHIFLKYTLQEVADQEGVSAVMIHKSISAALKKIREQMP